MSALDYNRLLCGDQHSHFSEVVKQAFVLRATSNLVNQSLIVQTIDLLRYHIRSYGLPHTCSHVNVPSLALTPQIVSYLC